MIRPNMATMLGYVATDANLRAGADASTLVRYAADRSVQRASRSTAIPRPTTPSS